MEGFFSCFDKEETELSTFGGFCCANTSTPYAATHSSPLHLSPLFIQYLHQ